MQVQLQHFHQRIKVLSGEGDHILSDAILVIGLSTMHSLKNTCEAIEADKLRK